MSIEGDTSNSRAPDEVSENNWVILYFPQAPVGAVFNRTGHRLEITELIN